MTGTTHQDTLDKKSNIGLSKILGEVSSVLTNNFPLCAMKLNFMQIYQFLGLKEYDSYH